MSAARWSLVLGAVVAVAVLVIALRPSAQRSTTTVPPTGAPGSAPAAGGSAIERPGEADPAAAAATTGAAARRQPPPRFVDVAPATGAGAASPDAAPEKTAAVRSPRMVDKDTEKFVALGIGPEQERQVRDVLRITRDRFAEMATTRNLKDQRELAAAVRELRKETDANLVAVLGEDKFKEWQALTRKNAEEWAARQAAAQDPGATKPAP